MENAAAEESQQRKDAIAAAVQRAAEAARADADVRAKRARQLLVERDREVEILRKQLATLEEDVEKGGPAERKLLQYAEMQADREREVSCEPSLPAALPLLITPLPPANDVS